MTWATRDLPVLKAIVEMSEQGHYLISPHHIAAHTNMDETEVRRALAALAGEKPPFFEFEDTTDFDSGMREIDAVRNPSGHARRAIGAWPTAEALAREIVAALEAAAEEEPDEEKRENLKQTARFLGGTGWQVLLGVAGNAASAVIGL